MTTSNNTNELPQHEHDAAFEAEKVEDTKTSKWKRLFGGSKVTQISPSSRSSSDGFDDVKVRPEKWSLGILNDKVTDEVPGSVLLMSNTTRNEPLGLRNAPARQSASSLPSPYPPSARPPMTRRDSERSIEEQKKMTADNKIILEPQPEDSMNDPLNWPSWRRDVALLSLGFYCALGGGMTPVLAAGFNAVSKSYGVSIPKVALTTGFYMMGVGLGSVVASPTAILFGKRPVYLFGIVFFIISAVWCAVSPNYSSLVIARIVMGFAVSPVECLPSATIAEIFFLHERAFRLGIYTLLLLGGKNLIPLISAAIVQSLSWQWVFWIIAMIVAFCLVMVFFFVPETFWDRTPRPKKKTHKIPFASMSQIFHRSHSHAAKSTVSMKDDDCADMGNLPISNAKSGAGIGPGTIAERRQKKNQHHVGFAVSREPSDDEKDTNSSAVGPIPKVAISTGPQDPSDPEKAAAKAETEPAGVTLPHSPATHISITDTKAATKSPSTPVIAHSAFDDANKDSEHGDYLSAKINPKSANTPLSPESILSEPVTAGLPTPGQAPLPAYTTRLRTQPPKTFRQTLKPWNGRLNHDKWHRVACRPFILFAYPAILWSALVYALSIGWLIVLSESVSEIYAKKDTYNFSPLAIGLVYISPFVGGVLGTAVAGKVSDIIVLFMTRRNGGIYEPEFRLVMAIPVMLATVVGLMGFGWSAEERDLWIVPTVFFGIISFGCSLGSTTAITFAVDSYRQYAGEALVTLSFSKNILHGLVFSLFFNRWLESDGSKNVFVAIGGIQIACLLTTIPLYIYGKRARMWTVRKKLMEKF